MTDERATDAQVALIVRLLQERLYTDDMPVAEQIERIQSLHTQRGFGKLAAHKMIERAKAAPLRQLMTELDDRLEDGFYDMNGQIFKVLHAVHGSGRQYAKVLDPETGEFSFAKGAIYELIRLGDKLSLDRAKELGHLYGRCMCCGATLTDEESIARGIGPVCARKWF